MSSLFAKSSHSAPTDASTASTRSVVTLQQEESGRFDKLRHSLSRHLHSSPKKHVAESDYQRPVVQIPAESVSLTQNQEAELRDESFARGGFINHLSADYDLHSQCPLPPLQARFENSFIYMPDEELVQRITLELQREYPHLHIGEQKVESLAAPAAAPSSSLPIKSVALKQGRYIDERTHLRPQPHPHSHLLPQQPQYYSQAVEPAKAEDVPIYNHHTDYYHLAADYDVHRRSHLPPAQARFENSVLYMPDEDLVKRYCAELQHEYPHLRPAIGDSKVDGAPSRFCFRFW